MKIVKLLSAIILCSLLLGFVINTTTKPAAHNTADSYGNPNPNAAKLNAQLGIGYVNNGNISRAKRKLNQAMKQGPNIPEVLVAMAYYYEKTGDIREAEYYYKEAIDLNSTRGDTQNNYGTFLCREKHYQPAIKHFMLAIRDPEYLNTAEAYENAGLCAMQIPDKALAESYFEKALNPDPTRRWALLEMGEFKYDAGDYRLAHSYLERYFKIFPPAPQSLWLGIRIARKRDNRNQAASYALMLKSRFKDSKQYQEYKNQV